MQYYLILLLLLPFYSQGQHAAVAAAKMNVFYIGVDNPVSIAVEGMKCSDLNFVVENGVVETTGECEYNVKMTKPGLIPVFIIKGKDTVYRTSYRSKYIPDPRVQWGSRGPSCVDLNPWRRATELVAILWAFDYDAKFTVESFEITVMRNKKVGGVEQIYCSQCLEKLEKEHFESVFFMKNEGAKFNPRLMDFVRDSVIVGDKLFIEEIKVRGPDNRVRLLSPFSFTTQ